MRYGWPRWNAVGGADAAAAADIATPVPDRFRLPGTTRAFDTKRRATHADDVRIGCWSGYEAGIGIRVAGCVEVGLTLRGELLEHLRGVGVRSERPGGADLLGDIVRGHARHNIIAVAGRPRFIKYDL